jgi:hypothetical protein
LKKSFGQGGELSPLIRKLCEKSSARGVLGERTPQRRQHSRRYMILLIVGHRSRRSFAQFKLRAHLLYLGEEFFGFTESVVRSIF